MVLVMLLLMISLSHGDELDIKKAVEDALRNSLELESSRFELRARERERRAARGQLFPTLSAESSFSRTDIPAYVLLTEMNQGRIEPQDFLRLTDPPAVSGFETRLTLHIPLWMGGSLRYREKAAASMEASERETHRRKREEVIFKTYRAFLKASLARSAVKLSESNLKDAREHLRVARSLYESGMALLSDVLRAQVSVRKAEEELEKARNNYILAIKALSLVTNTDYEGVDVRILSDCPSLSFEELRDRSITSRRDLKAAERRLKALRWNYRAALGESLPHLSAFASYALYDRDTPFGSDGRGYMVGLRVGVNFSTGLSTVEKALAYREREHALMTRLKLMRKRVLFEIEKARTEYENAVRSLRSAESRLRSARETLRIVKSRYRNGLARMVDLLDAQRQLELARFDYLQALYRCNLSYGEALFSAGVIEEVFR